MIFFVAPNPNKVKEQEGFLRRISAIDSLFSTEERIYFDDLASEEARAEAMAKAKLIYVHSIYQSKKIIKSYPLLANKIVTDLHGAVPEELEFSGDLKQSELMAAVEEKVFDHGQIFVAVSRAMAKYYEKKYKRFNQKKWIVLPIFENETVEYGDTEKKSKVIYSGGAQKWQNVDLMISTINKSYDKYEYTILTHSPGAFDKIIPQAKSKVTLKAVNSDEVAKYYKDASLGFILREDIVINNVACPTKLIEYLGNGIVPVVLSPNIGDFKELGYEYFKPEDLVTKSIKEDVIKKKAEANFDVLKRLKRIAEDGRRQLSKYYKDIKVSPTSVIITEKEIVQIVITNFTIDELENKIDAYDQQIKHQAEEISEYEKSVEYYRSTLNNILNSKRWKAAEIIAASARLKPHFPNTKKPST